MRTLVIQLLILLSAFADLIQANPRHVRATSDDPDYVTVMTRYGDIKGRNYNISASHDLNVFLGVPYAQPPVGDLRLARPEPIQPWSPATHNATVHGAKCVQRIITGDPVLENVPFSEDCLFLDIYSTRPKASPDENQPVMVYIHPGGFYGGSGAKYNFTNVALKGVVVVSVSYRLDVFGFLSTQDEIIPGNFGLLDTALALQFVKEIISDFGGNPEEITLFGASSGAAMVSILTLSPLTRGNFNRAIMQSGGALCPWAVFTPGRVVNVPSDLAVEFGRRLNCSLPTNGSGEEISRDLLTCLRATPVDVLVQESVIMQERDYRGDMIFIPVTGDSFGVLPETPEKMLEKTDELVAIPTIVGYSADDGSWLVPDPEDDGITYPAFQYIVNAYVAQYYPPSQVNDVYKRIQDTYLPSKPASLTPVQLRAILVKMATDFSMVAPIVKQARVFGDAKSNDGKKNGAYVYQFNFRPSYSTAPLWYGVGHADEKGFVLGLPSGPDPFKYPSTTAEDRHVADLVTTMWTNFAKFGDPTPQPLNWPEGLRWPALGNAPDDQRVLVVDVEPEITVFDRNLSVVTWTGSSGIFLTGSCTRVEIHVGLLSFAVFSVISLLKVHIL